MAHGSTPRGRARGPLVAAALALAHAAPALASPWQEDADFFVDDAGLPASKVDAADLDGDGRVDLVFANGAGLDHGDVDTARPQQAFLNTGAALVDASAAVFGDDAYQGRAVKLRDINGDGDIDIVLGTTWATQSQLWLNDGAGGFDNATATHLPQLFASVGDLEVGDLDGDGDLDLALTDWGPDMPVDLSAGGVTRQWRQAGAPAFGEPGSAMFEDVTLADMPVLPLRWAWELELLDIDGDWDLDMAIACFACTDVSLVLLVNDGAGRFTDATPGRVPQGRHARDVEPVDIDRDGVLDLVSLHDGVDGRDRVLLGDGAGGFVDASAQWWPDAVNPPSDDVMAAVLDDDGDGAPDLVLGARDAGMGYTDRLLRSVGGALQPVADAFAELTPSDGTYAIVLADFDRDDRLDVAMAQNQDALEKKVLLGEGEPDTAPPVCGPYEPISELSGAPVIVRARCHDGKTPTMLHDFAQPDGLPRVETWDAPPDDPDAEPGTLSAPGHWYGESLWRIRVDTTADAPLWYRVCAVDAAGNRGCTAVALAEPAVTTDSGGTDSIGNTDPSETSEPPTSESGETLTPTTSGSATGTGIDTDTGTDTSGIDGLPDCDCTAAPPASGLPGALLLLLLARRRRRPA